MENSHLGQIVVWEIKLNCMTLSLDSSYNDFSAFLVLGNTTFSSSLNVPPMVMLYLTIKFHHYHLEH